MRFYAVLGLAACVIGFCLLLTASRSAFVAIAVGAIGVAWFTWRTLARSDSARRLQRRLLGGMAVVLLLVGLGVAVAFAFGALDRDLIRGAGRSLGYRLQYWESTVSMIQDHPLWGCGPGNFQYHYTSYKLPEASEEIADPHNFLFEIAATAGLPALLATIAMLLILAATVWQCPDTTIPCEPREVRRDKPEPQPRHEAAVLIGAVVGLVLAIPVGGADAPWSALLVVTPVLLLVLCLLRPWIADGEPLNLKILALGILVLLIHLLAAGGIGTSGVAVTFWLLAALIASGCEAANKDRAVARPIVVAGFLLVIGGAIACEHTAVLPVNHCQSFLDEANTATNRAYEYAIAATEADPHSDEAWRMRSGYAFVTWSAEPTPQHWNAVLACRETALRNNPRSASLRSLFGEWEMKAFLEHEEPEALTLAVQDFGDAASLYPNSSRVQADLAVALAAQGERDEAARRAARALELDAITHDAGHKDKFLDETRLEQLRGIISTTPGGNTFGPDTPHGA